MKECNTCKEVKPHDDFEPDKRKLSGCAGSCRLCRKLKYSGKERYAAQREKQLAYHKKMRVQRREVYKARHDLYHAVEGGRIEKLPCEVCGEKNVEGHHEDYSKPLEVKWLCRGHHRKLHRKPRV